MPYLDQSLYPQVRSLIDTELDEAALPDTTIGLAIYLDEAEDWLSDRAPDPTIFSAAAIERIKRAGIRYMAYLIAPSIPDTIRAGDREVHEWRAPVNRQKQAEALRVQAEANITAALAIAAAEADSTGNLPTQFTVAPGRRGA